MNKILLSIVLILYFSGLISGKMKISKSNRKFYDEHGRTRIFHGVNVVYKLPPYIPSTDKFDPYLSLSIEDIGYMKKFGFNLVRFGVIWEAIEVSPNVYDNKLLDQIENLVNTLGKNGIYTMIDAHQDAFSRMQCGEGVPIFYVNELDYDKDCKSTYLKVFFHLISKCQGMKEFNFRKDDLGRPLIEDCKKK